MTATPCREQVVAAYLAVLQTVTGLSKFDRNRKVAITAKELPMGILFEGDEQPNDTFSGEDAFDLPLVAQIALEHAGAEGATACNLARANLTKAVLADRTLGGVCRDLIITDPGDWIGVDIDAEDETEGFMFAVQIRYATVEGDPFTFSN